MTKKKKKKGENCNFQKYLQSVCKGLNLKEYSSTINQVQKPFLRLTQP